jgi:hypothetical protein
MYLLPSNRSVPAGSERRIFKSTDTGHTWTELAGGPTYHGDLPDESTIRIRCSADGQVIVTNTRHGEFWISRNGGTTWTRTDFNLITGSGTGAFGDCSVSADGNTVIVGFEQNISGNFWPAIFISHDGGTSFTNISGNLKYPTSVGPPVGLQPGTNPTGFTQCNVAPDGLGVVVTFLYLDNARIFPDGQFGGTMYANVSVDGGATFQLCSYDADSYLSSSFLGLFTGIYITPHTPLPPPVVTSPGGYIIERLDNRVWPTVENAWCVDCGFTLARPQPPADLEMDSISGAGIITGVSNLVGGQNYSASTTAQIIDDNGLGPGVGAFASLTISGGIITAVAIAPGGTRYVSPAIVFNDPENSGNGASARLTLDNSAQFTASAPVFTPDDVGSVIRAGYGVAVITSFIDSQNVIGNILSPIVQVQPDDPINPGQGITQKSGTWTMTQPISQFYLPQLAGFEITGLADGRIIPPTIVPANGIVTLAQPASALTVGLAFEAQLQSTYLDAGEPTVQGQRKKVAEVTVRVEQSAAFQIGANQPDGSVQSPQELAPLWQKMLDAPTHAVAPFNSQATPLFTGDIRIPVPSGYNTRGQVAVQQLNPLPLQVLDFVPEVLSGDKPAQEAPQRKQKGEK